MAKKHQVGLDNRTRDNDGEIRQKRSDTQVKTLRKEYGEDFAKGHRGDTTLGTILKDNKVDTLRQYLKKNK